MKNLIRLEELAQFALGIFLFSQLNYEWWWFLALILLPDFSMIGYAFGPKIGAWVYNFFHHKALGIIIYIWGYFIISQPIELVGVILFAHSAMDRLFGYGLKLDTGFNYTHLGIIGKQ
jgi:hypothetical protein